MTILPQPVSHGPRWKLHDYKQVSRSAQAAADGTLRVVMPQQPQDELWLITRMVVWSDASGITSARVYLNSEDPTSLVDGTRAGNFDVADQASPIQMPGGSTLICVWEGADPGATGALLVQATVLKGG